MQQIKKIGEIDQGKYRKQASKWKWTEQEYNLQEEDYVAQKV